MNYQTQKEEIRQSFSVLENQQYSPPSGHVYIPFIAYIYDPSPNNSKAGLVLKLSSNAGPDRAAKIFATEETCGEGREAVQRFLDYVRTEIESTDDSEIEIHYPG